MTGRYKPDQDPYDYYSATQNPFITPTPNANPLQLSERRSLEQLNIYRAYEGPAESSANPRESTRGKYRSPSGTEIVKHRRTRKGCYTCRSRRVKCDEAHPICERCRKGSRDCVYPELRTIPRAGGTASTSQPHPVRSASSRSSLEGGDDPKLQSPTAEGNPVYSVAGPKAGQSVQAGRGSILPQVLSTDQVKGSSTLPRAGLSTTPTSTSRRGSEQLQPDALFYLEYHKTHLTQYHYCCKYDDIDFWHTIFLDIATQHEPLLNAVVAFAAFHYALSQPNGKLQDFLGYYDRSVSLLRQSLEADRSDTVATLLTILQLATFEESLGDWVNVLGHQTAAHGIITEFYTPQSIHQTATLRYILDWYLRFDLFAGIIAGSGTIIDREWFEGCYEFYVQQVISNPSNLTCLYGEAFAKLRLQSYDLASLFAPENEATRNSQDFRGKVELLRRQIDDWERELHPSLRDPAYLITDLTVRGSQDGQESLDWDHEVQLYGGRLWTTNLILLNLRGMKLMFRYQVARVAKVQPGPELTALALKNCQMFEAIEKYPQSPLGSITITQACLGIASLFLPKDERHNMWCRRKLALIEASGNIYPTTFRKRMAEVWGEEVLHWWLPNDEAYLPIIQSIRAFVEDRITVPRNQSGEDIRQMKGVFAGLKISHD